MSGCAHLWTLGVLRGQESPLLALSGCPPWGAVWQPAKRCRARVGSLVSALRGSRGGGGSPVGSEGAARVVGPGAGPQGWGQCRRSLLAFSRLTWKERQTLSLFHLVFGVNCRLTGTCENRFRRPPAPVPCPPDATVLHSVPSAPCPRRLARARGVWVVRSVLCSSLAGKAARPTAVRIRGDPLLWPL